MKALLLAIALTLTASAWEVAGFLENEITSGFNKICVYSSTQGSFSLNVRATDICPITARFEVR